MGINLSRVREFILRSWSDRGRGQIAIACAAVISLVALLVPQQASGCTLLDCDPDGSGTMTTPTSSIGQSVPGNTITFTYTAGPDGMNAGAVTLAVPTGWSAPSIMNSAAGYTTSSEGVVTVTMQTITVQPVTLDTGETLTITYGDKSGTGTGATAPATLGTQIWQAQQKSTVGGTLTSLTAGSPSIGIVVPADGAGSLATTTTTVLKASSGNSITFTYTADMEGMLNGAVALTVPNGWSSPSITGTDDGFTSASEGTVGVSGQTITVSGVTLAEGETLDIEYGDTGSGGSGATASSTTGAQSWQAQQKATSGGTLASLATSPSITVINSPDGSGALNTPTSTVLAGSTGNTITFTYTAATGGTTNGAVTLDVPSGWSAPSTTSTAPGFTQASAGSISVSGQTITVSGLTLSGGNTFTITYGSQALAGPGATATSTTGAQTWQAKEKSTSGGTLTNLSSSPSITVSTSADGSGTLTTPTTNVSASSTGHTVTFTYTAATGGLTNGQLTVAAPAGWSAPSTSASANGFTTASTGTVTVSGQTITVSGVTLAGGGTFTITYGSKASGGSGATASSSTGAQTWQAQEKSTSGGTLTNLAASPSITVNGPDGGGTLTTPTTNVSASSTGHTITFTYTAPAGGLNDGAVTLDVPAGWSAPSTTGSANGYTTASTGTVGVSGQTITVSGVTIPGASSLTIVYGSTASSGSGATASSSTGAQTWQAQERSTTGGTLTNVGTSPSITVNATDGSGTLTTPTTTVSSSSAGNTITFTYTAATGGLSNGAVTVDVPAGWTAPNTTLNTDPGYTTASTGTASASGQKITVSGVTLAGGATLTIVYGNKTSGGPGATATLNTGAQTWQAQEKSTSGGTLTNLASSPSITVVDDGTGTLTTPTTSVIAASTGNTITFTYTAAGDGMSNGAVTLDVPPGWSAPSTTGSANGYTTASAGTVSVASRKITVSGVTLSAPSTITIVYGSKALGGSGATAPTSTGPQTWQAQQKSTSGGTLTNLASSPSITVANAPDGSGTMSANPTNVPLSSTGNTITFTYTAATGGMNNGSVTLDVPAGWSAPSTTGSANGYTTSSAGTVGVAGQTITVSGLTLSGGSTFTINYGDTSGGGSGATAPSTADAQTWQAQQKSTSGGTLTNLASSPTVTVNAADGSGTLTTPTTDVSASSTGNTITFTYTAATGGMTGGAVTLAVPTGWSAPSTTGSANGYTTASTGTVGVSGQTITVSGVTLSGGSSLTIVYGSKASGGSGATATATTGSQTWQGQEKSTSGGTLTNLASSPSITVNAADGSGTLTTPTTSVLAGSTGNTITFTYTAATGGMNGGAVTVVVPTGWSAPSTTGSANGFTTASTGTLGVAGQTITVSGLTLSGGSTLTIVYGSTGSGGAGATAPSTAGAQTWQAQEKSTSAGTLANLASSPSITVSTAADGSGTLTTPTTNVSASSTGNTITFTYTAATGGTTNGAVTVDVPAGWSAPSTTGSANGFTTASTGTVGVSGQTITVSGVTLSGGSTFTIVYGSKASGGSGATAAATTGAQTWQAQEKSTSGGTLTNLASSPSITVNAADGSGTLTTPTTSVLAATTGHTITFTYTAATGGVNDGAVTVVVPTGWSAPSTTGSANGYTTASTGTVGVSGQTITVSGVTVSGGSSFTLTYGDTTGGGSGATAPSTAGAQTWQAQERSTSAGTLTNLATSPSITVSNAADGSGTLTTPTTNVSASSTGNTITFTYTAATGGMTNGAVTVDVPTGWSAPSTTGSANGFTTASTGTVGVSGQTITVSAVTLSAGSTFTIVYGSKASGGSGATATSSTGPQTWQGQQKATSGGALTNLASSPSITVNAADGSGTLTTPTSSVLAGSTGHTITFTYTAATGGMNSGAVTVVVPTGWSAPSTTGSANGYTTASTGTVGVSGQTITVSGLTLSGGATFTITYGDTTGGGSGATAPSTAGAQTWQAQERSTSAGTLTNLAASPSITVSNSADGSGTLTTPTTNVSANSTGNTITFTYTAATGGMNAGAVTVAVPTGWSAPSTTGSANGFTTASTGTVGVSGQTITVSGVTLSGGSTLTIVYGSKASSGPGATATSSTGPQTWQGQQKSTSGGALTNTASSPSITVNAADGSGTLTTPTTTVSKSSTGNTITFTYTAATGGMNGGTVTLDVPTGWSSPSTVGTANGYTTASTGTVGVSGPTITVSGVTLSGGSTLTIVYGNTGSGGSGATAPSTAGAQTWQAQESSTSAGTLTNLASSPSINVAADGGGTLTTPTDRVTAGSTGNTITFTYTAGTGGLDNGAVTIDVPTGWNAPSTTPTNAGYTKSSTGTVGASGQTITVSGVTLSSGSTFTITYGDKTGGGTGATAPSSVGAQTWQAKEKASSGGTLTNLASSPSIVVGRLGADFDGDGNPDILYWNKSTGKTSIWYMGGTDGNVRQDFATVDPNGVSFPRTAWVPVAVGDFDGQDAPDILYWNKNTGRTSIWYMGGTGGNVRQDFATIDPNGVSFPGTSWVPKTVAQFDGQDAPDILYWNKSTGKTSIWFMGDTDGHVRQDFATVDPNGANFLGTAWIPQSVGEFNGQDAPDILYWNSNTGRTRIWYMGGTDGHVRQDSLNIDPNGSSYPGTAWIPEYVADFNGQDAPDILYWKRTSGKTSIWYMGGTDGNVRQSYATVDPNGASFPGTAWEPVG